MEDAFLLKVEFQVVAVLILASLVAIVTRYIRIPYTVALVFAGLAVAFQESIRIEMTPELVLALFVPPLVFEAALHVEFSKLRSDLFPIITMAIPGVLLSTFIIGGLLTLVGLSFPIALLFGALISATDPVAVVATFRAVGAPKRLTTLVEGESLFNDGTAVVLFGIMLEIVTHGLGDFSIISGVIEFLTVAVGGGVIGFVLGYIVAKMIAHIDDYLIEITLTTVLAFGSFLLAEHYHFSGVLAVVVAGLVNGNLGPRGMSPTTRIVLFNFWEYLAFLANSFVFILIGMNIDPSLLVEYLGVSLFAVVVVLVARAINVYGLGGIVRLFKPDLSTSYLHVMWWGGLRGAISLALVLFVPITMEEQPQLLAMTFAVVLFTLLIQATTIPTLLGRLGFTNKSSTPVDYELVQGKLLATRAARRHIDRLYNEGALIPVAWRTVKGELEEREQQLSASAAQMLERYPGLEEQIVRIARMETFRAQRAALSDLAADGLLSNSALAELEAQVDEALSSPDAGSIALNLQGAEDDIELENVVDAPVKDI